MDCRSFLTHAINIHEPNVMLEVLRTEHLEKHLVTLWHGGVAGSAQRKRKRKEICQHYYQHSPI